MKMLQKNQKSSMSHIVDQYGSKNQRVQERMSFELMVLKSLHGCRHTIIPDRIEAGTFMIIAAAVGEGVMIDNVIPQHLESLTAKLREMGVNVEAGEDRYLSHREQNLKSVDIKTLVYPGFPTDLQQPFTSLINKSNWFKRRDGYDIRCTI